MTGLKTAAPLDRRRGGRAAALLAGCAAVMVAVLSGCGAGQNTQTASIVPPLTGLDGETDGLAVRDVMIGYPGPAGYRAGESVPLLVRIFNNRVDGPPVKLVGVTANVVEGDRTVARGTVVLVGPPPVAGSASATGPAAGPGSAPGGSPPGASGAPGSAPTPGTGPSNGHTASGTPTPSAVSRRPSPSATATPAPSPTPVQTSGPGSAAFAVPVPPGGYVLLLPETGSYLAIVGLDRDLTGRDALALTFQFDDGKSVTLSGVRIGVPTSPASRAPGETSESER